MKTLSSKEQIYEILMKLKSKHKFLYEQEIIGWDKYFYRSVMELLDGEITDQSWKEWNEKTFNSP
jgi:hypothetical protein